MLLPAGEYRYEIRRGGESLAVEHDFFELDRLGGLRFSTDGTERFEAEASLDSDGFVIGIRLRYSRGPFRRSASYKCGEGVIRGALNAMGGQSEIEAKLGRFREVDGDLLIFKALIIAHVKARGQSKWTGRVATIEPTLTAVSYKQSYGRADDDGQIWVFEPRMGDSERIELDSAGRIIRRIDVRGDETRLIA
jgi:hypothetical protein